MKELSIKAGFFIKANLEQLTEEILNFYINYREKNNNKLNKKDLLLYRKGIKFNLSFLAESISYSRQDIYDNAIAWAKKYLSTTHIPVEDISTVLKATQEVFKLKLPEGLRDTVMIP